MDQVSTPMESYISYMLAAAHRAVHQTLAARLKDQGMQVETWRILEALDSERQLTMGELARTVLMNPPTLTKMVDRMVSQGLVHRQIAASDQRKVNLLLTDLGRKRMTEIRELVRLQDREILAQFDPQQVEVLNRVLRDLSDTAG
ncbi:DNA-binding transcriptional regulator, MarR family [Salinihabitans flavidus]|uniref:DNA-binding transcriptional regulator, MarR family n=2 Tax=Salinihabitans flavidus TaxID=569882 RepID=A0A1H8N7B3_9RHOB|nr:DNA-binding transcriptional regulator, MarR family [Salinihabitans flavidus]